MRTLKGLAIVFGAAALLCVSAGKAEARFFEAQPHWWNSGALCISARNPPGRRWRDNSLRGCVPERETTEIAQLPEAGDRALTLVVLQQPRFAPSVARRRHHHFRRFARAADFFSPHIVFADELRAY